MNFAFVVYELDGLKPFGGIGVYYKQQALMFAEKGWNIYIFFFREETPKNFNEVATQFYNKNITLIDCNRIIKNQANTSPKLKRENCMEYFQWVGLSIAESVKYYIEKNNVNFDFIEYADWGCTGTYFVDYKKVYPELFGKTKLV